MKKTHILLLLALALFSCEDTTASKNSDHNFYKNLERGGDNKSLYTYFDLDEGEIVETDDYSKDSKWDIGFGRAFFGMVDDGQGGQMPDYRSVIVTNGGVSGSEDGAGYLMSGTSYNELLELPENIDTMLLKDKMENDIISPALLTGSGTWYNYDFATHHLVPNTDAVLIVKTPEAKFVKISIISLYKLDADDVPDYSQFGFISFKFEFLD